MLSDPQRIAFLASRAMGEARSDPLLRGAYRFWSSEAARSAFSWLRRFVELLARSGNTGAKSAEGARIVVALMRGLREIDGRTLREFQAGAPYSPFVLPRLQTPNTWVHLVQSYRIAAGASLQQLRGVLGDWPYHEAKTSASLDYTGIVYVKPDGCRSDRFEDWSRLIVFPGDGPEPEGLRADGVWRDEPGPDSHMRAARRRNRGRGRPFIVFSTVTPIDPRLWLPIRRDFEGCAPPGRRGRVDVSWPFYDNQFLTKEDIARQMEDLEGDPEREARVFGDYCDTVGRHPWGKKALDRLREMRQRAWDGQLVTYNIRRQDAGALVQESVESERWFERDKRGRYYVVVDASSGVDDPEHDPGQVAVFRMDRPGLEDRAKLVELYSGYVGAVGLGFIGGLAARYWNGATADPEMNAYGEAVLLGLELAGYRKIAVSETMTGQRRMFGFSTNATTRGLMLSAARELIESGGIEIPSASYLQELLGVRIRRSPSGAERIEAAAGAHDESLITLGRFARVLLTAPPELHAPEPVERLTPFERWQREMGIRPERPQVVGSGDFGPGG